MDPKPTSCPGSTGRPDAETAWADRHPTQASGGSYSAVKRLRPWRHQRSADRHAGTARRGGHPACLPCARDRRDPLRRAVIVPSLPSRATSGCHTTTLRIWSWQAVPLAGQRRMSIGNTCHDSYPSEVMTTYSTRETVERTCVKRHKPHDERVEKARNPGPPACVVLPTRHRVEQTLPRADAIPLLHAELRASLGVRRSHVLAHPV